MLTRLIELNVLGRILGSLRDRKVSEDHNDTSLNGDPIKESQPKGAHLSQFLPTSRRIVQFSNGKVSFLLSQWIPYLTSICNYVFLNI